MKKIFSFVVLFVFVFMLVGCGGLSKGDIMAAHLESGSSIEPDPSVYTFVRTVDASFGALETELDVNIISVYLYEYDEYDPMGEGSSYTKAYLIVEDKYALKNGASLAVDLSKYIIIYSDADSATSANEGLLIQHAEDILNGNRALLEFGQIPTFDLLEILQEI